MVIKISQMTLTKYTPTDDKFHSQNWSDWVNNFNFASPTESLGPFVLFVIFYYVCFLFDAGHILGEFEYLCRIFYIDVQIYIF